MNIIKIDLPLPDVFYEIEEKMKKLTKEGDFFSIAGGSISNIYMGLPVRDIDIFCDFQTTEDTLKEIKEVFNVEPTADFKWVTDEDYHSFSEEKIPYLIRFEYKGYPVEIISAPKCKIYEFDIRFRQFYFYKGEVYTTREAITDIKNKEIVVVNPNAPMSTLFRIKRFEEQFGFFVKKESVDFTKWAFKHVYCTLEKVEAYLEKNAHKISKEANEELLAWFREHSIKKDKFFWEFKEGDGKEATYIYDKTVSYPFNPDTKDMVIRELKSYWETNLGVNYELIKNYKPIEKEFSFKLTYRDYEEKIKEVEKKLKKSRVRYLLTPEGTSNPFPSIKEEELPTRYTEYFNNDFLSGVMSVMETEEERQFCGLLHGVMEASLKKEINIEIKSLENTNDHNLGDVLTNNVLEMTVDGTFAYYLRKCDNGKYTISGFKNMVPDGAGFYQNIIGKKLKECFPSWFDFSNNDLKGVYRYAHSGINNEYYFTRPMHTPDLIDTREKEIYGYIYKI